MAIAATALIFVFVLGVIVAAISDVTSLRIPNAITYGLTLLFIPYAAVTWGTLPLLWHLALFVCLLATGIFIWQLGWMGGGDAKLIAAAALWMGPANILVFGFATAVAGGVLAGFLLLLRKFSLPILAGNLPDFVKRLASKSEGRSVPYGLPIAIGAIAGVLQQMQAV